MISENHKTGCMHITQQRHSVKLDNDSPVDSSVDFEENLLEEQSHDLLAPLSV